MQSQYYTFGGVAFLMLMGMGMAVFPVSATIFVQDGFDISLAEFYNLTNNTKPVENNGSVVFFYKPDCSPCIPVHEYLDQYLADHPDTTVEMVNMPSEPESEDLLNESYVTHNREWIRTPVMFIGPIGLEGTDEIITNFEGAYHWYKDT